MPRPCPFLELENCMQDKDGFQETDLQLFYWRDESASGSRCLVHFHLTTPLYPNGTLQRQEVGAISPSREHRVSLTPAAAGRMRMEEESLHCFFLILYGGIKSGWTHASVAGSLPCSVEDEKVGLLLDSTQSHSFGVPLASPTV